MTDSEANRWLPQRLRRLAGGALQGALNRVLALDPDTVAALPALEGRSIELHARAIELTLAISVKDGRLHIGPPQANADLRVAATPASLLALALRRHAGTPLPGKVEIAGDADLARRLQHLAQRFAPDFEEAFAQAFGDVLGVPLARAAHAALGHVRDGAAHLALDSAAWLQDEARVAPSSAEMDSFLDDVDALRERSERLAARFARIRTSRPGTPQ